MGHIKSSPPDVPDVKNQASSDTHSPGKNSIAHHAELGISVHYPLSSRRFGEEGEVVLKYTYSTITTSIRIDVFQSSGFERLDRAAYLALQAWLKQNPQRLQSPESRFISFLFELH